MATKFGGVVGLHPMMFAIKTAVEKPKKDLRIAARYQEKEVTPRRTDFTFLASDSAHKGLTPACQVACHRTVIIPTQIDASFFASSDALRLDPAKSLPNGPGFFPNVPGPSLCGQERLSWQRKPRAKQLSIIGQNRECPISL
jgi:hypothetical protein